MIPVPVLVAMLLGGVFLIGLGGAIYAGAFRAKVDVRGWESDREKRVSSLHVPIGGVLVVFAIAGVAVNYATATSWGRAVVTPPDFVDAVAALAREYATRSTERYGVAGELDERATAFYRGDLLPPDGMTSAEAGHPSRTAARDNRTRAQTLSGVSADLMGLVAGERWRQYRDTDHGPSLSDHAGTVTTDGRTRMDTQTLATRLEGMAALFRTGDGTFAVSWFYVDPTPDGPGEARTVHTVELDGTNAAEVLNNLDGLISRMTRLEHVAAEGTPGRVVLEALGTTAEAGNVRGTAVILEPYATPLQAALDITPTDPLTPKLRQDLTLELVERLAQDPNMAPGVQSPEPPAVEVPPSDPIPSDTTGATPEQQPQGSPATPSAPDAPQPQPDSPAPPESSTPSAPQPTTDPATSGTAGGTTDAPVSGDAVPDPTEAGGVVVRGNSDAPQPSGPGSPSPDPTSTTTTGTADPAPVATGQQPGTPDGAPTNADGTPVEPTAGTTADVGAPASDPGLTADPQLPGQRPVDVSETPLPSGGAGSTGEQPQQTGSADTITADQGGLRTETSDARSDRIAALRQELAELEAGDGGQASVTSQDGDVQVATHVDAEPEGGQNLASGQGGGASGDPAGGGYGTSAGGGAGSYNSDGM